LETRKERYLKFKKKGKRRKKEWRLDDAAEKKRKMLKNYRG